MNARKYTLGNFALDCLMTAVTGGLWLIWVVVREIRNG